MAIGVFTISRRFFLDLFIQPASDVYHQALGGLEDKKQRIIRRILAWLIMKKIGKNRLEEGFHALIQLEAKECGLEAVVIFSKSKRFRLNLGESSSGEEAFSYTIIGEKRGGSADDE